MKYFTTTSGAARRAVDCVIVGIYNRGKLGAAAAEIDKASKGHLSALVKSGDVSPQPGRCVVLTGVAGVRAPRIAVVGLGKSGALDAIGFRKAVAAAIKALEGSKTRSILNALTVESVKNCDAYYLARHSAEVLGDTLYRFTEMKSGRKKKPMPITSYGHTLVKRGDAARSAKGAEHGDAIAHGVMVAKDLGNLPSNVCTPSYLARTAKKMASGNGKLTTRVFNETEMKKLGMHSLLSVTAGATEPAKLIVMQYKNGGQRQTRTFS